MFNGVCVSVRHGMGFGVGVNAFVSIMETHIDYDHFPSITRYKRRGGKLRKKNGKREAKERSQL